MFCKHIVEQGGFGVNGLPVDSQYVRIAVWKQRVLFLYRFVEGHIVMVETQPQYPS